MRDLAKPLGARRYHTWLSRHSPAGFPDEVLVRRGRLIFAELKCDKSRLSAEQEACLEELRAVPGVEVYVWRPAAMDEIASVLRSSPDNFRAADELEGSSPPSLTKRLPKPTTNLAETGYEE